MHTHVALAYSQNKLALGFQTEDSLHLTTAVVARK